MLPLRKICAFAIHVSALFLCSEAAAADNWPIGKEREVDEGTYMQVVAANMGWRIWRIETKSGVDCKAVKSAKGQVHPEPLGVSSGMFKGKPFLEIWHNKTPSQFFPEKFTYRWWTTHSGSVRIKYRTPGSKFWEERTQVKFNADGIVEQQFEIVLTSWEYPELYEGFAEQKGIFDFTGLSWAKSQVVICEDLKP
jgi:hypothetical protein